MTEIKICGITNLADALHAVACGANALGFIFYRQSPRYIAPAAAAGIIARLPGDICKVGVFVNEAAETVRQTAATCGLDLIQLHGDETIDYCEKFHPEALIKALPLETEEDLQGASRYPVRALLVDARADGRYGGTGKQASWSLAARLGKQKPIILAGGLKSENIVSALRTVRPRAVDICSGVESAPGKKDAEKVEKIIRIIRREETGVDHDPIFAMHSSADPSRSKIKKRMKIMKTNMPDSKGHFGVFGGRYVAETLMPALIELEEAYRRAARDPSFQKEFRAYLKDYAGRETPLYFAANLTEKFGGARIYLKREDLNHTGAHKINNTLGQALLARRMGKKRVIAETGAGQHGVATATVAALFGMECEVFMGAEDIRRQEPNVFRMKMLGAEVTPVTSGTATLKDAMNEAMRQWVSRVRDTFYVIGTTAGPHPYPQMVRDFQSVIGREARRQLLKKEGRLPDFLVACVGGGSNAMGLFYPFRNDGDVAMVGVEAGGKGIATGLHAASISAGQVGVLHGNKTYLLQDKHGQVKDAHSISAGLDYPGVGPEHSFFHAQRRAQYVSVTDDEALAAFMLLTTSEGIMPAMESAHAIAYAAKLAPTLSRDKIIVICLSGRGDKDMGIVAEKMEVKLP